MTGSIFRPPDFQYQLLFSFTMKFPILLAACMLLLIAASAAMTAQPFPENWKEARNYHQPFDYSYADRINLGRVGEMPDFAEPVASPNGGYSFTAFYPDYSQEPEWSTIIYINTERDSLLRLSLINHNNARPEIRWINEKLLFIRVWWGRTVGTDMVLDVEHGEFAYREMVIWGEILFQQYKESMGAMGNGEKPGIQTIRPTFSVSLNCNDGIKKCDYQSISVDGESGTLALKTSNLTQPNCFVVLDSADIARVEQALKVYQMGRSNEQGKKRKSLCVGCNDYSLVWALANNTTPVNDAYKFKNDGPDIEMAGLRELYDTLYELIEKYRSRIECDA